MIQSETELNVSTNFPIFVVCHKFDFFLAKIAIASIRYYYPTIPIILIKDEINGKFNTEELEHYFNVLSVKLSVNSFGWTSAKVFLLLSEVVGSKKFVLMDADVVFVGKVLEGLQFHLQQNDFVVSPEFTHTPGTSDFSRTYFDINSVKKIYPEFRFPGFTFNTGFFGATAGVLSTEEIQSFFDVSVYPYWTELANHILPTRDQSLLNIILPMKQLRLASVLKCFEVMWWFLQAEVSELQIDDIAAGKYPYVIHWAGGKKVPFLTAMTRGDILRFFQWQYYARLPWGRIRYYGQYCKEAITYYLWTYPRHLFGFKRIPDWTTPLVEND